jgi:hypothetical protein
LRQTSVGGSAFIQQFINQLIQIKMQVKTIKKVISNKLNEWLETIEDAKLREKVKANILVSGGSITSLFLNEPVNDYDIYIQNMDVLIELAKYYVPNDVLDGRKKEEYIKANFEQLGHAFNENSENSVRLKTLKSNQVKLNIPSIGLKMVLIPEKKYQVAFLSQNAISLTDDLQIVLRFNGNNQEIHKTFDYIHATNFFTFKDGLVTNVDALQCILSKTLKYQGSLYPITSIVRMKKFINRGWNISAGEMLKIMFQISELDLKNPKILEEQLIGVDIAYFSILIEALRNVDSKKITSAYINTLIDKIFNEYDEDINS